MAENQNDPLGILKTKADPLNILQKPKTAPVSINEPLAQPPVSVRLGRLFLIYIITL
jgi:hypothetical protein